jgi:ATP adenylyltransferase
MKQLWAPWRLKYIREFHKEDGCIFCLKPQSDADWDNLILFRGRFCFVIMNLYPYTNGHLLVVPYRHTADCSALRDDEALELWKTISKSKDILAAALYPEGFNLGMNLGRCAGAVIDQHLHLHIVPRWDGDTNFMPITADTKIVSQGIFETYDLLKPFFEAGNGGEKVVTA